MTKPVATIEIAGHLLCCGPCQHKPGPSHPPPHVYTYRNFGHPSPTGITRIEWVDVPKPKRAKAKRPSTKQRIEAVAAKVSTWPRWKRGGSAAKAKRKG